MDSMISGKTKLCGLFGDPVEHSVSPQMHNAAFRKLGLDYCYLPFRVAKENAAKAVDGVRAMNLRGVNVTVPNKVAVIPSLDKLEPLAEKIGAVNTVVNDDGFLTGDNTDAAGFLLPLLESGVEPEGKNVVVLGAGGGSRAVSFALADRGARVVIVNRTLEKAQELAQRISQSLPASVRAVGMDEASLEAEMEKAEIVVNTTSLGLKNSEQSPVPGRMLRSVMVVYDIVYNPPQTRLLREAGAAGARTIAGLDMLVRQGALAFEKWTGEKAPVDLMKQEVASALGL